MFYSWMRKGRETCFFLCILIAVSLMLLLCGLSVRSLWGPEGRWAEIVREMIRTGNYFWPTINGEVYFDKPLLSYWLMAASVRLGGLNEAMLRVPGVLASLGTLLIVFSIGRRLFSARTGLLAAMILITSPMFLFWSRTASAELLNTFAIWLMFWAFLAARSQPRIIYFTTLYGVAAVSCFFKGPIAPAVCFFTILLISVGQVVGERVGSSVEKKSLSAILSEQFFWLFSRRALPGLVLGLLIFVTLLLLPVVFTKSWISTELMWRENVVRFFQPFDHKDPPHAYIFAIALFCAPWTFCMLASLGRFRLIRDSWSNYWAYGATVAMFLFFLLSGSRRSYYILPLIPALALITADGLRVWIEGKGDQPASKIRSIAMVATIALLFCIGAGLFWVYFSMAIYRHVSELMLGGFVMVACAAILFVFLRQKQARAIVFLVALVAVVDFWGITTGAMIGERGRTVKEFSRKAAAFIDRAGKENVAFFRQSPPEVLFYLNRDGLKTVIGIEEAERFRIDHPRGLLLLDMKDISSDTKPYIQTLTPVLLQDSTKKKGERLAVMQFP